MSGTRNGIKSAKLQTILCQNFAANIVQMKRYHVCVCAMYHMRYVYIKLQSLYTVIQGYLRLGL
jgi:hypothetical protein